MQPLTRPTDRRKRKNYYITYMLDVSGVFTGTGLESHITTGDMCMLTTVVDNDCEDQQHIGRAHAAKLLLAYRKSQVHRVIRVRGKDWIR